MVGGAGDHRGQGGHMKTNEECGIREVWNSNLDEEMKRIRTIVNKYNYVAMDTEFPGVVARPIGEFKSTTDYQYQLLRCNVGLLRLIQVGLTFMNEHGQIPPDFSSWQFNFKFSLTEDMYAQDSIDLLQQSGLIFPHHEEDGIDPLYFAELLITSGLVLSDNVTWLSFHSGYDFGYLLKLLTNKPLPSDESEFFDLLRLYFPKVYDVKYLMKSCRILKGGLQEVADQLEIERIGPQHQAGSDSLLTGLTFFKMKEMFFEDALDEARYCGNLYGLGLSYTQGAVAHEEDLGVISNGNAVNALPIGTPVTGAGTGRAQSAGPLNSASGGPAAVLITSTATAPSTPAPPENTKGGGSSQGSGDSKSCSASVSDAGSTADSSEKEPGAKDTNGTPGVEPDGQSQDEESL